MLTRGLLQTWLDSDVEGFGTKDGAVTFITLSELTAVLSSTVVASASIVVVSFPEVSGDVLGGVGEVEGAGVCTVRS